MFTEYLNCVHVMDIIISAYFHCIIFPIIFIHCSVVPFSSLVGTLLHYRLPPPIVIARRDNPGISHYIETCFIKIQYSSVIYFALQCAANALLCSLWDLRNLSLYRLHMRIYKTIKTRWGSPVVNKPSPDYLHNIAKRRRRKKNSAYGRHWIPQCVRIVAPIPKQTETDRKEKKKKKKIYILRVACHVSCVMC